MDATATSLEFQSCFLFLLPSEWMCAFKVAAAAGWAAPEDVDGHNGVGVDGYW